MMKDTKVKLLVKDCAKDGNIFYFIASEMNLIFSLDVTSLEIKIVSMIPEKVSVKKEYLGSITVYQDELYIGSIETKDIWIYNLKKNEWKKLERKDLPHIGTGGLLQSFVYKNWIYMLGSSYPAIIKINSETKKMIYIEKPFEEKEKDNIDDAFFRAQHVIKDDVLFIPCCLDNTVLLFNLNTEEYEWHKVGSENNRYSGITFDGKNFWLSPRLNSPIVMWDGEKSIREFQLSYEYSVSQIYFGGCSKSGNNILFWNFVNNDSIRISIDTQTLEKDNNKYSLVKEFGDLTVFQKENGKFEIYKDDAKIFSLNLEMDYKVIKDFYKTYDLSLWQDNKIYIEGQLFSLENYLGIIVDI